MDKLASQEIWKRQEGETVRDYLERIPSFAREKSGLGKVREFLGLLGDPDREFQILHVAGTNGKGSVCAFLSSILKEAGIWFGCFTSPHLEDIKERFSVDGSQPEEDAFDRAFETVYRAVGSWMERGELHPTYFEYLFYIGLVLFREAAVPVVILETGMGGRLDVTNVAEDPVVTVITSISLEHTRFLGDTIEEIAGHKAGIIKPGRPVLFDGTCIQAAQVIKTRARELGAPYEEISSVEYAFCGMGDQEMLGISIRQPFGGRECEFWLPFAAPYQAVNGALAVKAAEYFRDELMRDPHGLPGDILKRLSSMDASVVASGLKKTVWPARMEEILPGIYLDGGHNEDGIRAFSEAAVQIRLRRQPDRTWLLFAVSSDKDYRQMLRRLGQDLAPEFCLFTRVDSARGLPEEVLLKEAKKAFPSARMIRGFSSAAEAFRYLKAEWKPDDLAFIAGSLYLAGELKGVLADDKF